MLVIPEKPRKRWLDDVEDYLKKTGVRGWRKIDNDKDAWKSILREARVNSELYFYTFLSAHGEVGYTYIIIVEINLF
jgi:hypothetical protein